MDNGQWTMDNEERRKGEKKMKNEEEGERRKGG